MNPVESRSDDADATRAWLSALADGRTEAVEPAIAAWSRDADARRTWHAYQVIGDVLRSEDLAAPASHDEAFLQRLRQRLATEPVVLAPQPLVQPVAAPMASRASKRPSWRWSAAAAVAGFALVGGAVLTLQRGSDGSQLASSAAGASGSGQVVAGSPRAVPAAGAPVRVNAPAVLTEAHTQEWHMLDESVVRDARLASYLRAHRGSGAVGGRVEPVVMGR